MRGSWKTEEETAGGGPGAKATICGRVKSCVGVGVRGGRVETLQDGSNGFDDDDRSGLKEEGPSRKCCLLKGH